MTSLQQPTCMCSSCLKARLDKIDRQTDTLALRAAGHDDPIYPALKTAAILAVIIMIVVGGFAVYADHLRETDQVTQILSQ